MFNRNIKLVGLVALLTSFLVGCGKSDEINPLASRHLVTGLNMAGTVTGPARSATANTFSDAAHCVQWIEYRLDGEAQGQRLEISNQPCPGGNQVFALQTRVARLRISSSNGGQINNIYDRDANRLFGQFRMIPSANPAVVPSTFQLSALCSLADASQIASFSGNCAVSFSNGKITKIVTK